MSFVEIVEKLLKSWDDIPHNHEVTLNYEEMNAIKMLLNEFKNMNKN